MQDAKEQIRQAIDIVDLAGGYMALRRQGRGYVALCPWHEDSRPSLQINPDRQSFKCWVCDIGGDIFSLMMRMEGLDFREALEMLADRAGVELAPQRGQSGEQDNQFDRRNLYKAMAWAEGEYHQCLLKSPEADVARQYLIERRINQESIEKFRLGFAPNSWDWLLKRAQQAGGSPAVLERVGMVGKRQTGEGFYDRFRGRLMFSIRDARSRPIAFGGRVLPGVGDENPDRPEAKYINSPETPLFSKSGQLYALDLAKDAIKGGQGKDGQGIVVMEGYTDVIMAHQHGVTNAVAVLGTALGDRHVPLVRRFTDQITLVLDGDEAGQKRTMQILDELLALFVAQEIDLKILTLPQGADPCDVIDSHGREHFQQLLSTAVDALDHKIAAVTNGLASPTGKAPGTHASAQAVEEILGTVARAFPTGSSSSSVALMREQQVMSRLSRQFGIGEETIRTRLTAKRREQVSRSRTAFSNRQDSHSDASAAQRDERFVLTAWEKELLELILHQPEVLPQLMAALPAEEIPNTFCRQMYQRALDLHQAGQVPTFEQLMLTTDDSEEKNLLVECDELGHEKSASDTEQRVKDLLSLIAKQKQEAWRHSQLAELKQNRLDPEHEQEVLNELFNAFKQNQKQ